MIGKGSKMIEETVMSLDHQFTMKTYNRNPLEVVRASGVRLYDPHGNDIIDFLAGVAVCSVGHSHPKYVAALVEQIQTVVHVSNLVYNAPAATLAAKLCRLSAMDRVFFANSGAEANEAALKIARKRGRLLHPGKTNVVSATASFHGRTIATVSAGGQAKYSEPFGPLPAGFIHVPYNDIDALAAAVNHDTAAIFLEPIQGEGGIHVASAEYLAAAREIATENDAFLIFDEVQTGVGRTGKWWAWEHSKVQPDIMTLAKGLGGGFPIGACLARGEAALVFAPGDHGSTYAGNPMAATAALSVIEIIGSEGLLANATNMGLLLQERITQLANVFPDWIGKSRGKGLMLGIDIPNGKARGIVSAALVQGLLINATADNTIRFVPPLILNESDICDAMQRLQQALESLVSSDIAPQRMITSSNVKVEPGFLAGRHLLSIDDFSADECKRMIALATRVKAGELNNIAPGKVGALLFEKPSLRTKVSFLAALAKLGATGMYLGKDEVGLGVRESVEDVGRVLTRMVDVLIVRTFDASVLRGLAAACSIPVINALDDAEHPCQAFADFLTMQEHLGTLQGKTLTYVGDGNNVAASLMLLSPKLGVHFRIACPDGYTPAAIVWKRACDLAVAHGTKMERFSVPEEAVCGADAVYTDVWTSMGQEEEKSRRLKAFYGFTVTSTLMEMASPTAIALHCLPAHRGDDIADDVIEGRWSRVFAQAENRLHAQQAILAAVL